MSTNISTEQADFAFWSEDGDTGATALQSLGALAGQSRQIFDRIATAESRATLMATAGQIDDLVTELHRHRIGVGLTSRLICELSDSLLARLWALIATADVQANSCLIVMGSEGRGEQILKTDQDNGLLLRDGHQFEGLAESASAFTDALLEFGYPRCPGGIMLSNPSWRQGQAQMRETIRRWCYEADSEGAMHLAILLDARAVAGASDLLAEARQHIWTIAPDTDAFIARFSQPVEQFDGEGSGGWWHKLVPHHGSHEQLLDLKKLGSFQIVHGVRSLALKHRIDAASTARRLRLLVDAGHLPAAPGRDLLDSLHVFNGLKLANHLRQRRHGRPADNLVRSSDLSTIEQEQLKGAIAVVKTFRKHLQLHCLLNPM